MYPGHVGSLGLPHMGRTPDRLILEEGPGLGSSSDMKAWLRRLRARYSEPPPTVPPEHQRFYFAASYGYPCGLLWHFLFIFLFWRVGARPLALLNIGATAIWILALRRCISRAGCA